jgi:hypothetical protein
LVCCGIKQSRCSNSYARAQKNRADLRQSHVRSKLRLGLLKIGHWSAEQRPDEATQKADWV